MKILAVNGSPNRVGSTAMLIDMLLEVCRESGAECETVSLEDYTLGDCADCDQCFKSGGCVQRDDFMQLKARMLDADGIIIGSPYYGGKPTDQLKLLLDRLAVSCAYKHPFAEKYMVGVASSAVNNCKGLARYCANLGGLGLLGNGIVSGLLYESMVTPEGVKDIGSDEEVRERARTIGKKLIKDIQEKPVPMSNRVKCLVFGKWLSYFTIKLYKKIDRLSGRVQKYCIDKGWIKSANRME